MPKLLDFGIAKIMHGGAAESRATAADLRIMTPEYASPEQMQGRAATTLSDVYALGVVLYELLTGARAPAAAELRESARPSDVAPAPVA